MKRITEMVCNTKKDIDRCVITPRCSTGLFVAKIWYNNELMYAVYGYNAETRMGVRVTDYYPDDRDIIARYPESMFVHWYTYYLVSEV